MTDEPKLSPGHHQDGAFPYTVLDDGSVQLPQVMIDHMQALVDRDSGLQQTIQAAVNAAQAQWAELNAERRRFWATVSAVVGFAPSEPWTYDNGVIRKQPKPQPGA
jgi:hypothetical protein